MAWPFDNQGDTQSVLPIDYGVQRFANYVNQNLGNNRNTNNQNISGQLRGYGTTQAWPEYNENLFQGMGVGRFDPRNLMRPDNLTQDLGAATYTGPRTPEAIPFNPNQGNIPYVPVQEEQTGILENFKNKLSGFTTPAMAFIKKMGGVTPEKKAFYDAVVGERGLAPNQFTTGQYGGKDYEVYNSPSGLKVGSDIIGKGQGYEKNLYSAFGSKSIEEMEEKKLDWFRDRVRKGKAISQRGYDLLDKYGDGQIKTGVDTVAPARTDRQKIEAYTGSPMSEYRQSRPASERQFTGHGRSGMGRSADRFAAEGGRIGYRERGFVDPDEPAEDIFEFMKDQGVDYDQMAEAVPQEFLSDELGAINVDEDTLTIITDLLGKGMTDVSTISTLTGKDEGTIERVIRVLTTQSQAQGGSVGYFDGGIASLV